MAEADIVAKSEFGRSEVRTKRRSQAAPHSRLPYPRDLHILLLRVSLFLLFLIILTSQVRSISIIVIKQKIDESPRGGIICRDTTIIEETIDESRGAAKPVETQQAEHFMCAKNIMMCQNKIKQDA